jgi:hypothetical protein
LACTCLKGGRRLEVAPERQPLKRKAPPGETFEPRTAPEVALLYIRACDTRSTDGQPLEAIRGMIDAMLHILSKDTGEKQKGENELTGKNLAEVPNMAQRTLLQYLSMDDWKIVAHLPIPAGELMLSRLLHYGWIESRGEKQHTAIRLTPAGLKAMRSPI